MHRFNQILLLISLNLLSLICFADLGVNKTHVTCYINASKQSYPCAIGKNGIHVNKQEGDKATPAGEFVIREFFYRPDKIILKDQQVLQGLQQRGLKVHTLTPDDAWVDDVGSSAYNQHVKISSFKGQVPSHEYLWRDDDMYDIIGVMSYNDSPIVKGKGSAIFLHVAQPLSVSEYAPTVGCVALAKQDLLQLLSLITPQTVIEIPAQGNIIRFK